MTPSTKLQIAALLQDYTDAAQKILSPVPQRVVTVAPGAEVAWDECCDGYLYTRIATVTPIVNNSTQASVGCGVIGWVVTADLGVVRCAATINDQGIAPSPAQITADGVLGAADLERLAAVLTCVPHTRTIESWVPEGPEGGCFGGFWRFTMRINSCGSCEES